jgi:hypothetical protein
MWHSEPDDVRARYQKLAEEEKSKHALQYPEYKCAPRKASEIKKRKRGSKKTLISIEGAMSAAENVQDTEKPTKKRRTDSQLHRSDSLRFAGDQRPALVSSSPPSQPMIEWQQPLDELFFDADDWEGNDWEGNDWEVNDWEVNDGLLDGLF